MTSEALASAAPAAKAAITLSICIPTYNRASTVEALVRRVLSSPAADIEVAVLDNGSSDDTLGRLRAIDDPRLAVHANGSNRGVLFNVLNVLLAGRGRISMLLLDKDDLHPRRLDDFVEFLRREQPACGFCEYDSEPGRDAEIFPAGYPALARVAYTCHHPTGYFFDRPKLGTLDIGRRFTDYELVGHFPFEFMFAELALQGRGAIYHGGVVSPERLADAAKQKSFGTNASREDAFFSPKGRLKMALNFSRHVRALPLRESERRRVVAERYLQGIAAATKGYRQVLESPALCSHYHMKGRLLSRGELRRIALDFHRQFVGALFPGVLARGAFMGDVLMACGRKLGRRLARTRR